MLTPEVREALRQEYAKLEKPAISFETFAAEYEKEELRQAYDQLSTEQKTAFPFEQFRTAYNAQQKAQQDQEFINRALSQGALEPGAGQRLARLGAAGLRAGGPLVGGALGTLVEPGFGTYGGLVAGGAAGESAAQTLEQMAGLRNQYSPLSIGAASALPIVPVPGLGPTTAAMLRQTPVRAMAREALRSGIQSGVSGAAMRKAEGQPITPASVAMDVGLGAATGGALTGFGAINQLALSPRLGKMAAWGYQGAFPNLPDFAERTLEAQRYGQPLPSAPSEQMAALQFPVTGGKGSRAALVSLVDPLQSRLKTVEQQLQYEALQHPAMPLSGRERKDVRQTLTLIRERYGAEPTAQSRASQVEAATLANEFANPYVSAAAVVRAKRFIDRHNPAIDTTSADPALTSYNRVLTQNANMLRGKAHKDSNLSKLLTEEENLYQISESQQQGLQRILQSESTPNLLSFPQKISSLVGVGPTSARAGIGLGRRLMALTGEAPTPLPTMAPRQRALPPAIPEQYIPTGPALPPATTIFAGPPPPSPSYVKGVPAVPVPGTRAQRLGLLLPETTAIPAEPATPPPSGLTSGSPLPDISAYYTTTPQRTGRLLGPATAEFPAGPVPTLEEGVGVVVPAAIVDEIPQNARRQTQGLREGNPLLPIFGGESALRSLGVQGLAPTAATVGGGGTIRITPAQARTQLTTVTEVLKTSKSLTSAERDVLQAVAKDLKTFLKGTR